jgi:hypothetical protein
MRERFCANCKHSRKESLLPGTGVSGKGHYWVCLKHGSKPRRVYEHGVCGDYRQGGGDGDI